MLVTKITDNFYQLTDVFSEPTFTILLNMFANVSSWDRVPQTTKGRRLQSSIVEVRGLGDSVHTEIYPALEIAEKTVGTLYQNGPQLWYDTEKYINAIHDGDVSPNHCVNVQVYLNDGDAGMGTWAFDNGEWHQAVYRKNCGYMLIGPTRIPHGMKSCVVNERMSLYSGYRNTKIPSDIW